jgi:hypothetical protein
MMKQEGTYNNKRCWSFPSGILDCFGRASLAMTTGRNVPSLRGTKQSRRKKHEGTYNNEDCTTLAGILDCFSRASLAMTSECLTMNSRCPSLRGTKQSRIMKQEETYNNEGCRTLADILDCFGRASLAMTSECLTTNSLFPSLRGTKQSMIMRQTQTNNDEHCLLNNVVGISDCFAALAMTKERLINSDSNQSIHLIK